MREPALVIVHKDCGRETGLKARCEACDKPFGAKEATATLGRAFAAERQARRESA